MDKLKSCPFCGSKLLSIPHDIRFGDKLKYVECGECHAQGPWEINEEEAVDRWNKRAYSWDLLMEILDEVYPVDIFIGGDIGCQIIAKLRDINELRKLRSSRQ